MPQKSKINKAPYVTIIHGCGGWNSCWMTWDEEMQCHTPWQTGINNTLGDGSERGAIIEAQMWAENEGVEYKRGNAT